MKRAFPQKVKPVPSCITENDVTADQTRQASSDGNRLIRTSAAVIGLAISMGAHSLAFTHQHDDAIAAEPPTDSALAAPPSSSEDGSALPVTETASAAPDLISAGGKLIKHVVQEGQTLWQLAQLYGADEATVALINRLSSEDVLHVGQVLTIPVGNSADVGRSETSISSTPGYYGLVADASAAGQAVGQFDMALKLNQDVAINDLKQKREALQVGLGKLKAVGQETPASSQLNGLEVGASAVTPVDAVTHRVVPGDTLSAIAKAYGVSQRDLAKANRLANPNVIRVSQVLAIPVAETASLVTNVAEAKSLQRPKLVAMTPISAVTNVPVITADTASDGVLAPVAAIDAPSLSGQSVAQIPVSIQVQSVPQTGFQARVASPPVPSINPQNLSESASVNQPEPSDKTTQVATAPFALSSPEQNEQPTSQSQRSYVDNLRMEIVRLREKYRDSGIPKSVASDGVKVAAITPVVAPAPESSAISDRINPEFNPSEYTEALRSQVRKLQVRAQARQAKVTSSETLAPVSTSSQPQLVATAPLGSQTYEPLVPSSLGKMVSPELPPLGAVENYLPGNSGRFNGYIWPAKGLLTSGYGWRWGRMHKGIDIAAPIGTPVVAAAPGVVITSGWNSGGYGNLVEIQHPDGSVTLYAHNDRNLVRVGQQVEQGQQIAEMGSTGYSTGPHSHFEVHLPGHGAVNPMAYLPRSGA